LKEFREVLDEYTNKDGKERMIMTEGNNFSHHFPEYKLRKFYQILE